MQQELDADGVRVVLSAPQLAAVLTRGTIDQTAMLTNRLWGGVQIAAGVLEMVGASALCVLPEPTMASKAGCIVFGAHGSDTAAAGLRQLMTGIEADTLTQRGAGKFAQTLKAQADVASRIGMLVDLAVPFGFASSIKAVRVARITSGRIDLQMHEAKSGSRLGGHTIEKHVGRTEAQLRERLRLEPERRVVSSFRDLSAAQWAISQVMENNASRISGWARSNPDQLLILKQNVGRKVGYGIVRATGELRDMNTVRISLKFGTHNGMPYYILTSYLLK
ncbi:hypothetical protein LJ656_01285 [Paraburkholderia sp. MMS20-SJTR3]|uniref:Bacterial CdiA-CT RNAse A domain-containing protein n=1 Tax=Paraburkholderia sejongensis TaxID=2886946 RepID=A0ABS8JMZ7_9BURK|nr:RNase A-like domain-containing protein [Paraburkholderia sp. MMS20-SJTR3]MCC8391207.1 hypothetical protein [Paraburkholderia sp. MMS20-SJTR3]